MSTKRLTKEIRKELLKAVFEDQTAPRIKQIHEVIKLAISQTLTDEIKNAELLKTYCEKAGIVSHAIKFHSCVHLSGEKIKRTSAKFPWKMRVSDYHEQTAITVTTNFELDCRFYTGYFSTLSVDVKQTKALQNAQQAEFEFVKECQELIDNLWAVLSAATTVKQLQEMTDVFNPFLNDVIPGTTSTALVPTQAILALNELESPNSMNKAA